MDEHILLTCNNEMLCLRDSSSSLSSSTCFVIASRLAVNETDQHIIINYQTTTIQLQRHVIDKPEQITDGQKDK